MELFEGSEDVLELVSWCLTSRFWHKYRPMAISGTKGRVERYPYQV